MKVYMVKRERYVIAVFATKRDAEWFIEHSPYSFAADWKIIELTRRSGDPYFV